jgi:hypothetical protein
MMKLSGRGETNRIELGSQAVEQEHLGIDGVLERRRPITDIYNNCLLHFRMGPATGARSPFFSWSLKEERARKKLSSLVRLSV